LSKCEVELLDALGFTGGSRDGIGVEALRGASTPITDGTPPTVPLLPGTVTTADGVLALENPGGGSASLGDSGMGGNSG
jgi:hypothetical protein